jgi:hypothetical protein
MPFNLQASIGLDGSKFAAGIEQAKSKAAGLKASLNSTLNGNIANQFAGIFSAGAIAGFSKETINFASHINDLHDRVDVSREGLQKWGFALKQNGSDIDSGVKFFEKLGQAREKVFKGGEAGDEMLKNFKEFGVTMDDLKNKRLEDIGLQIGNAVKAGDVQKLGAALREVGGKAATELVPAFKNGLQEAFDQAPVIGEQTIAELDDIGDAVDKLTAQFRTLLAPAIVYVTDLLGKMLDFIKIDIGGKAAFLGTLFGGGSIKDAFAAQEQVKNDIIDARIKNDAEKTKKRDRKATPYTDEEVEAKKKAEKEKAAKEIAPIAVDSLAKIGAFLGNAGYADPMLTVAQQQLETQQKIEQNTNRRGNPTAEF